MSPQPPECHSPSPAADHGARGGVPGPAERRRQPDRRATPPPTFRIDEALDGVHVGLGTLTADGTLLCANTTLRAALGLGGAALPVAPDAIPDVWRPVLARLRATAPAAGVATPVVVHDDTSGVARAWAVALERTHDAGFTVAVLEVSERERAAEQLRQADRAVLGLRAVGSAAHEIGNMLTVILGFADSVEHDDALPHPLRADVAELRSAAERAAALTRQLLVTMRAPSREAAALDLNDGLRQLRIVLERLVGRQLRLELALSPDPLVVALDSGILAQIVLNLVMNARDATPTGGAITVSTARVDGARATGTPGDRAKLIVADTGSGMDETTRRRAFEPFFTTKPAGHGTGLGLAEVARLVHERGGEIHLASAPGRGTVVELTLPTVG